jgi:hypothetical protein
VIFSGPSTAVHSIHSAPPSTYSLSLAFKTAVPVPSTSVLSIVLKPPWMSDPRSRMRALVEVSNASFSWTSLTLVHRWK